MAATVLLKDIVDALDMQFDEHLSFLDLDTGQVETVSRELLGMAEELDDEEGPDLPEWQEDEWETAKRIISSDRVAKLPSKRDVHEWSIMEEFSHGVASDSIREDLLNAIHRSGAFRKFKDTVRRCGIEQDWFAFRDDALRQIAIDWCEEHKIQWK
jgi:hypothetical protein